MSQQLDDLFIYLSKNLQKLKTLNSMYSFTGVEGKETKGKCRF